MPCKILPPFNEGCPLEVVRLQGGKLGVRDVACRRIWVEQSMDSTSHCTAESTLTLPEIPLRSTRWKTRWIGGLSKTERLVGMCRSMRCHGPNVILFAVHVTCMSTVVEALKELPCRVGEQLKGHETYGDACEVVVYRAADVSLVTSRIARAGATPMFEDSRCDSRREIGVERLDRIDCRLTHREEEDPVDEEGFGLKRGRENWRFHWVPDHWTEPPITWDHMVSNVLSDPDAPELCKLPQPLRQHVAKAKLESGMHQLLGTRWIQTTGPCTAELEHDSVNPPPFPLREVVRNVPGMLAGLLAKGLPGEEVLVEEEEVQSWQEFEDFELRLNCIVLSKDGRWFRPVDTRREILDAITTRRWVSAALTTAQSRQLVTAFYLLTVEKVEEEELCHAAKLILFHYLKERGYTARWYGPYYQEGEHVGNGDKFRSFPAMKQYRPHNLPASVLNRLCDEKGRLHSRGSKGSRAKRVPKHKVRYVPTHRILRTKEQESKMLEEEED